MGKLLYTRNSSRFWTYRTSIIAFGCLSFVMKYLYYRYTYIYYMRRARLILHYMYYTSYRVRILCAWRYLLCAVFDVNFLYGILIENKQTNILNAIKRTLPRHLSRIIYVWLYGFSRTVYVFVKINNQRRRMVYDHTIIYVCNIRSCILVYYIERAIHRERERGRGERKRDNVART